MDFADSAISMCNSMWYALDTKIDNVIIVICIFMCNTDAVIKNVMVSVADRCCRKARGVVGMHTKRKVSTATAVV